MGNTPSKPPDPSFTRSEDSPSACPVDPAAREAWLAAASKSNNDASLPPSHPHIAKLPPSSTPSESPPPPPRLSKTRPLGSDRVISSIPRSSSFPSTETPSPSSRKASLHSPPDVSPNAQTATPSISESGNWIYPSERMFFDAMKRKQHSPRAQDMAVVVPIHNAVNERAWTLIKRWEQDFAAADNAKCNGPRLRSFSGDSSKLSPRARWNSLWGYEKPFDRHDWVVERCARSKTGAVPEVEYVIDFYRGRESARGGGIEGGLNFYLDVRPKLNSWEGWRMRTRKMFGL